MTIITSSLTIFLFVNWLGISLPKKQQIRDSLVLVNEEKRQDWGHKTRHADASGATHFMCRTKTSSPCLMHHDMSCNHLKGRSPLNLEMLLKYVTVPRKHSERMSNTIIA